MAHSLLVARQFSSSSGSSSACPGCDRDVDLEVAPLSDPVMGATLAFAILNFIALAVLFVLGCLTRKFVARDGKPRTRFGLLWALGFYTIYQLLDVVNTGVTSRRAYTRGSYLIMYPFWNFFGIATDTTLVWTLFGFLWARMHALHGHSRLARGTRIAAIVMVSVEAVIGLAYEIAYCIYVGSALGRSANVSVRYTVRAMAGLSLTFDCIRLALAFAFIGLGATVFTRYRRSSNFSKIPLILLTVTFPFYLISALSDVIIGVVVNWAPVATDGASVALAQEFTRGVFKIVVLLGLVLAARCHDWASPADARPHGGYGMQQPGPYGGPAGYDPVHQGSSYPPSYPPPGAPRGYGAPGKPGELGGSAAPYPELAGGPHPGGEPYYRGAQHTELDASQYRPVAAQPAPAELNSPRRF